MFRFRVWLTRKWKNFIYWFGSSVFTREEMDEMVRKALAKRGKTEIK